MDLQNCLNFQRELLNLPPTVTQWQTLQKRYQPKEICMQEKNNKFNPKTEKEIKKM